jgi:hypothetical protein
VTRSGSKIGEGRLPIPRQQVLKALGGMIRQAGENVGEPGLGIDVVELGGGDQRVDACCRRPPSSEPVKVQFFHPTVIARSSRSAALLDMHRRPFRMARVADL